MFTSNDSCSTMPVMFRLKRKTRFAAPLMSTTGPSPLALTTVFSGTRKVSIMREHCNKIVFVELSGCELPTIWNHFEWSVRYSRRTRAGPLPADHHSLASAHRIQELPHQFPHFLGLFPRRIMPCLCDHSDL